MQSQVMTFWLTLFGYEAAWFCSVTAAGNGMAWPGVLAATLFVGWRLIESRQRRVECLLLGVALLLGASMESVWIRNGWITYASTWPMLPVPAWILGLWACFALTVLPLFGYLRKRTWLAVAVGGVGGPLAYAAAEHGWHAVMVQAPAWRGWCAIAVGWGVALPLLVALGHRNRLELAASAQQEDTL